MATISTAMTADHRRCDEIFTTAEELVSTEKWSEAESVFFAFRDAMLNHFSMEEETRDGANPGDAHGAYSDEAAVF